MAEVVANSTSKLSEADLRAIAVYIKDVTGQPTEAPAAPAQAQMDAGKAIFSDSCAACHQADGKGVPRMFPPLAHNANVQSADATSLIRVIVKGARTVPTEARPTAVSMPAFGWKLDDKQIAAVATYVRNAWGNAAPPVDADNVRSLRTEVHAKTQ
jgi:cbb3-type cytochrome c oxidase subunit III